MLSKEDYKRLISARKGLSHQEKQRLVKGIKKALPHDMPVMGWGSKFVFPDVGGRHLQKVLTYLEGEGYRIVKVRDTEIDFSTDYPGAGYEEDAKEVAVSPMHMVLGSFRNINRTHRKD